MLSAAVRGGGESAGRTEAEMRGDGRDAPIAVISSSRTSSGAMSGGEVR